MVEHVRYPGAAFFQTSTVLLRLCAQVVASKCAESSAENLEILRNCLDILEALQIFRDQTNIADLGNVKLSFSARC